MLRILSELCTIVVASAGILAMIGLILIVSTVISVQPLGFELWQQTPQALTFAATAAFGLLVIGRIRLTERFLL